jgi:hypothetical protein
MFQMTSQDPKVQVREEKAPTKPVQERVRASSTPAGGEPRKAAKPASAPANAPSNIVDGWSSTTTGGAPKSPN